MIIEERAYARAGLLGNPSDGYFGKTISISVRNFGAHISLFETPELRIEPQFQDRHIYTNIYDLVESVNLHGYYGGDRLIKAAIKKFCTYCGEQDIKLQNKNFTIRYNSTIPRQVGLAGSSAIITATIRALLKFYNVRIPLHLIPSVILAVETEKLGINAGLQDRVIQVYEGCVFMDFAKHIMEKKSHGKYERLDPALLPKLYIAYKTELGKISGQVLNTVKVRFDNGDKFVIDILDRIAQLAEEGKKALAKEDIGHLNECINMNFDLRSKIMQINQENLQLITTARDCGASAKFSGSGGSIIGIYEDDEMLNRLLIGMKKIKARVIKPYVF